MLSSHSRLLLAQLRERCAMMGEQMAKERKRFATLASQEARAVSAFNLFQTPKHLAARMAELLDPKPGKAYLDPSAGLGRLIEAIQNKCPGASVVAVEQSAELVEQLLVSCVSQSLLAVHEQDFLSWSGGPFAGVIMNPPFKQGLDVKHIRHAHTMLAPGGRLVALCYDGTKQRKHLKPWADYWEELPKKTFSSEGTSADVCLLVKEKS